MRHLVQLHQILLTVLAVAVIITVIILELITNQPTSPEHDLSPPGAGVSGIGAVPARPVPDLAQLPSSTTFTTIEGAPPDLARRQRPGGQVVHPRRPVPIYAEPGGEALASLPTEEIGSPTWLPVIAEEPGWVQVLLPSRPNGSTGWLSTQDSSLDRADNPFFIAVNRDAFQLSLYRGDELVGTWVVGVGKPGVETPAGRTFVLASITDTTQSFSPVILPLGTHSASLETYGGGPGVTGIHGWPTDTVFGHPSSDGCIRVPADALRTLTDVVPLGTPVLIT